MTLKDTLIKSEVWNAKRSIDHVALTDGFERLTVPELQALSMSIVNRDGKAFELIDQKFDEIFTAPTEMAIQSFIDGGQVPVAVVQNLIKYFEAQTK